MGVTRIKRQINVTLSDQTLSEINKLVNDMNIISCSNRSATIAIAVHELYRKTHAAYPHQEQQATG